MESYSELLHVYTITWNEEKIIQDFINWYRNRVPGCKITIWDNMSTDNTIDIALAYNCEVIPFDTGDQMDEQTLIDIRNTCWVDSNAKYCCIVDADEWVALNKDMLLKNLDSDEWTICKCEGYEMFGLSSEMNELICGTRSEGYCKPVLFRKDKITEMNFAPGSHSAEPTGDVKLKLNYPNLYHTKWRTWENGIKRAHLLAERRSEHSKSMGWNVHYQFDDDVHKDYYMNGMRDRIKIR